MSTETGDWADKTLGVFDRTDARGEPLTTREVTDRLDCTRRAAYDRLQRLVERGDLDTKKVGARGRIWWRVQSDDAGVVATSNGNASANGGMNGNGEVNGNGSGVTDVRLDEQQGGPLNDVGFFSVDEAYRLTAVDGDATALFEARDGGLVGESLWDVLTALAESDLRDQFDRALDGDGPTDVERYAESLGRWVRVTVIPAETGLSVSVRDVTAHRERKRELERYEAAVETIGDGVYIVDDESRFLFVNDAQAALTGYDREELLGTHASRVTTEEDLELAEQHHDNMETVSRDVTTIETELVTKEGTRVPIETRFALFPLETGENGRVGVARDITERRARKRELERYETVVETITDGVYALDEEDRFEFVNDAYAELMGYDREEILGAHVSTVVDERGERTAVDRAHGTAELDVTTADGETLSVEARYASLAGDDGEFRGTVGVVRDVTARKEHEQELEARVKQQEAVTELGQLALETHDLDRLMARASELVSETLETDYCKVLDLTDEGDELLLRQGVGWDDGIVGTATVSAVDDDSQAAHTLRTDQPIVVENLDEERRFGGPELLTSHGVQSGISTIIGSFGTPWGILGTHDTDFRTFSDHDINFVQSVAHILSTAIDRRERERDLKQYETIVEAIDDGVYVLDDDSHFVKVNDAYAQMMGYDREELLGEHCSLVVGEELATTASEWSKSLAGGDDHATIEAEIERADGSRFFAESRFQPLLADGVSVGSDDADAGAGVNADADAGVEVDTDGDSRFAGTVGVVRDTTDRHRRERELERQREQLAALNDLRSVISGVTDAVIAQSTREEIEQAVCDRLADAETYQFAWVGEIDRSHETVRVKTTSGHADIEGTDLPIGEAVTAGSGEMVDAAVRTRTVQIRRHSEDDWLATDEGDDDAAGDATEPVAVEPDIEPASAAAIPIVHDEMVLGVVVIATDRPDAFEDDEQATIDHLGETIGHAIASIERKRALMSDEVIELRFETRDLSTALGLSGEVTGTIDIARTVPISDGQYVVYGTVTDDAVETLETLAENYPHWEVLRFRDHGADEQGFEVRVSEPSVTSAVAAQGGEIVEARIVDGTATLGFHLPPGADVRAIGDTVRETYPGIKMVTRRQVRRDDPQTKDVLETELTDRQRAALEASYQAGFFEWPRATSGEGVAEALGINPSTFHQHLRTAERKLFASLLD